MEQIFESAFSAAGKELNIEKKDMLHRNARLQQGLCWLSFSTEFQKYECAVEPASMEVLGINSEPDNSGFFENYKYQSI